MHVSDWLPTALHLALPRHAAALATNKLDGRPVWPILRGACDRTTSSGSSSGRSSDGSRVYGLGCRGAPVSVASHLPVFGNGRDRLDLARMEDWARRGPAVAAAVATFETAAAVASAKSSGASAASGPQLPPLRFVERGAYFSADGSCKVFLDPDAPSDSHGVGVRSGRAAPSRRITGGDLPGTPTGFKRTLLVELPPPPTEAAGALASPAGPRPFAVAVEAPWLAQGVDEAHCQWEEMRRQWQEQTRAQEPDYGGRLERAPDRNNALASYQTKPK